jgi:CheY-like chemotaxis protein
LFLPRAQAAANDQQKQFPYAIPDRQTKRKSSMLVVDDDKTVLKSTLRMLDFLGHAAIRAESGREALRLIASELEIDLVLADFAMPEMSGVELERAIHATRPTSPVILVTGYGELEVLKNFGKSRILQKPYTKSDFDEQDHGGAKLSRNLPKAGPHRR